MRMKTIEWDFDAWEDYLYWQQHDKKKLRRVNQLIKDLLRNPLSGILINEIKEETASYFLQTKSKRSFEARPIS